MLALCERKNRSPPPTTPTSSPCLVRRGWTKHTHLDFALPPAAPPRLQSRKSGRQECSKRVTAATEAGNEKGIRLQKPRSAYDAWKRSPTVVSKGLTIFRLLPKSREPRHSQFEEYVLEKCKCGTGCDGTRLRSTFRQSTTETAGCHQLSWTKFCSLSNLHWFLSCALLLPTKSTGEISSSQLRR